jgi:hypothetical protein
MKFPSRCRYDVRNSYPSDVTLQVQGNNEHRVSRRGSLERPNRLTSLFRFISVRQGFSCFIFFIRRVRFLSWNLERLITMGVERLILLGGGVRNLLGLLEGYILTSGLLNLERTKNTLVGCTFFLNLIR